MGDITDKEKELILKATAQGIDLHEMAESIKRFTSRLLDNDLLQKNIEYIIKNKHK